MTWWLILHTPDGPHLWQLGDPDDDRREDLVMRARTSIGFPAGESWLADYERWHPMLSNGDPHPTLLAAGTVHDVAELAKVPDADVQAYRCDCQEATKAAALNAARAAVAQLDPAQRDALRAELGSQSLAPPKGKP